MIMFACSRVHPLTLGSGGLPPPSNPIWSWRQSTIYSCKSSIDFVRLGSRAQQDSTRFRFNGLPKKKDLDSTQHDLYVLYNKKKNIMDVFLVFIMAGSTLMLGAPGKILLFYLIIIHFNIFNNIKIILK